jgi:hypothetical protein
MAPRYERGKEVCNEKIKYKLPNDVRTAMDGLEKEVKAALENFDWHSRSKILVSKPESLIQASLHAKRAMRESWEYTRRVLREQWFKGRLDIPGGDFDNELDRLAEALFYIQSDIAVLQTSSEEIE